jgi:hypothetical protein
LAFELGASLKTLASVELRARVSGATAKNVDALMQELGDAGENCVLLKGFVGWGC